MTERLIPNWRILAAGLSFVAFGIGGVLLRIIVFPFLYLLIWSRKRRILLARSMIRLIFRFYIGLMGFMGLLRY